MDDLAQSDTTAMDEQHDCREVIRSGLIMFSDTNKTSKKS
jgi:hypothetical protein